MRKIRSILIVTSFSFGSIIVSFFSQIIIAKYFGSSYELDAFFAAYAIPQYIISVSISSLGFVLIPLFLEYRVNKDGHTIFKIVSNLINCCIPILFILTFVCVLFAKRILQISAPGLNAQSLDLAIKIFVIIIPTIALSFINSVLRALYRANQKFGWQAFVPFLGLLVGLLLLIFWGKQFGVIILAISFLVSTLLETILLTKVLLRPMKYTLTISLRDPILHKIFRILFPLILIGLMTKFTPLLDRYLASQLKEGSISLLNYAYQFPSVLVVLISTGIATVNFSQLAFHKAEKNIPLIKETILESLKVIWVLIVPLITIGYSLSLPLIILFLQRGEFTLSDSLIVSSLLKIYLLGLIGMGLGAVTGKILYIMQDTKTMAIVGIFEGILYAIYTFILTKLFGVQGIAMGFVIYFSISVIWQFFYMRYKINFNIDMGLILFSSKILFAGILGGSTTYIITLFTTSIIIQIFFGGILGLGIYILILFLLVSDEMKIVYYSLTIRKNWTITFREKAEE